MKRKIAIGLFSIAGGLFMSSEAFAQPPYTAGSVNVTQLNPQFFIAILAGVLLALGFQLVLTNLSVAIGVTVIGNLKDKAKRKEPTDVEGGKSRSENENTSKDTSKGESKLDKIPMAVKFMSGGGIWGMITAVISLFLASLFAVKLSLVPNNAIGVSLGLVIWAVFFMVMLYIESRALGAVMGGFFNAAMAAVRAAFADLTNSIGGLGSIFRKSDGARAERVMENTIEKIKDEVTDFADDMDLKSKLNDLVTRIAPQPLNIDSMKDKLEQLLNEIKIEERDGAVPGERELFLKVVKEKPQFSEADVSAFSKLLQIGKEVGKTAMKVVGAVGAVGGAAGVVNALSQTTPIQKIKEEVENLVVKTYLKNAGDPDLKPEIIKAELDEIFSNPRAAIESYRNNSNVFNREEVIIHTAARQGVSREEAELVAIKLEEAINTILRKANIAELASDKIDEMKSGIFDAINEKKEQFLSGISGRIEAFLDKVDRPELDFDLLRKEFEMILHHPGLTPEIVKRKIKQFDRNTLTALLSGNDRISKSNITKIVDNFELARLNVINRIDDAEAGLKAMALEQAENTRETAMAASWWLFGTFILSAIAAAIGGMIAL